MTAEERTEEIKEAAEAVEREVRAKEAEESAKPKAHTPDRKGLMERRESFAQTSVPNAHKGYSPKPPRVMMGIIAALFILSFILAAITA
jgi:hypothetical protein